MPALGHIALYGFLLNGIWEYAQLLPLYDCWRQWSAWQKVLYPLVAILGDVAIMVVLVLLTSWISETGLPFEPNAWLVLLGLSVAASLVLEWMALTLKMWRYKPMMPTLTFAGRKLGFSPVVQITLLPALSVYLASS